MRKKTRKIHVASLLIGDNSPIVIQSMTNTKTTNIEATVNQTEDLYKIGADLVRIAIPDQEALTAFAKIKKIVNKPLVADIHFDYKLAIGALHAGADKVRINPGNIGSWDKVKAIIDEAKHANASIRIGVNSGSLEKEFKEKFGGPTAEALVASAIKYDRQLLEYGFSNFVVSIKSSDVMTMIAANRQFSTLSDTPLHLGVTEAGTAHIGSIKSAIGLGTLLCDGIGDTFRVSLTDNPQEEIKVALDICKILGLRQGGIEIISCPTCGRTKANLIALVNEIEAKVKHIKAPLKVAIMGCVVNGPGEAEEADVGLALGDGKGALFSKGYVKRIVPEELYVESLLQEINTLVAEINKLA